MHKKEICEKQKKVLTREILPAILANVPKRSKRFGGIAQLGERLTGSQEVSGSIPLISTKKEKQPLMRLLFFFAKTIAIC